MSKMLFLRAVLFVYLVSSTKAILPSNRCLKDVAYYDEEFGCQCNEGYSGIGDLCCADDSIESTCHLGPDSWVSSYDLTLGYDNMPCMNRISKVLGKTESQADCFVEVWSSQRVVDKGSLYSDRLAVSITVGYGHTHLFSIVEGKITTPWNSNGLTAAEMYQQRQNRNQISGATIDIDYSDFRRIWTIKACGVTVTFRAVPDNNSQQELSPGVCVNGKKSSTNVNYVSDLDGYSCGLSSSIGIVKTIPHTMLLRSLESLNYLPKFAQDLNPITYEPVCKDLGNVAMNECQSTPDSIFIAISHCGGLLVNPTIRFCLSYFLAPGKTLMDPMKDCLHFQCNADVQGCKAKLEDNPALRICYPSMCD